MKFIYFLFNLVFIVLAALFVGWYGTIEVLNVTKTIIISSGIDNIAVLKYAALTLLIPFFVINGTFHLFMNAWVSLMYSEEPKEKKIK